MATGNPDMEGKTCLVTGATAGIGLAIVTGLARRGAGLVLIGRDPERGARAVDQVREAGATSTVFRSLDLADQSEVREFAAWLNGLLPQLDLLVNNAGGMFGKRILSPDGIEMTFALNHLAYFQITCLLLPSLLTAPEARVVNVASDAHFGTALDFDDLQGERRYSGWRAYKRSKLCNLLFTYELARRLAGTPVTANALHPGFVNSEIGIRNQWISGLVWRLLTLFATSPERGAETALHLACAPELGPVSGRYFVGCREKRSSPASYNRPSAQRLWDLSVRMANCDLAAPPATA